MINSVSQSPAFGNYINLVRVKKGTKPEQLMDAIHAAGMKMGHAQKNQYAKVNKNIAQNAGKSPFAIPNSDDVYLRFVTKERNRALLDELRKVGPTFIVGA